MNIDSKREIDQTLKEHLKKQVDWHLPQGYIWLKIFIMSTQKFKLALCNVKENSKVSNMYLLNSLIRISEFYEI